MIVFAAALAATSILATPIAEARAVAPVAVAPAGAVVDPARLAAARQLVAKLMPPGVYRTLMTTAMQPMMDNFGDSLKALPIARLAKMAGLDAEQSEALGKVDLQAVAAIVDPHWRDRQQRSMRAMFEAMGDFFTAIEPDLREAYAKAYAGRFTGAELAELNAFLATPTGGKFAGGYLTIATDPTIAAEMKAMMPKLMAQMPTFVAAAQKATADLPPPRKAEDVTPAERSALAKALGVDESRLETAKPDS